MAAPKSRGWFWSLSRLFSRTDTSVDETRETVKLILECMEQARTVAASVRFNHGQCKFLVGKLEVAVESVRPLLRARFDDAGLAHYLQTFKFLLSLATEVKSFIQICCTDPWIQAAVFMTDISKHVSFLGFNLEVFTVIFSKTTDQNGTRALTPTKVADMSKSIVETVKNKACLDELRLLRNVENYTGPRSSGKNSGKGDRKLADFLLGRLRQSVALKSPQESDVFDLANYSTEFVKEAQVGKGGFAAVCRGEWLGITVARKVFEGFENPYFNVELTNLRRLSHPNIVRLFGYERNQRECSIVMELMDGNLRDLIAKRCDNAPFTILEALDIMHQVGEGVLYLHEQNFVHRDLKSENILYKAGQTENGYVHVKVADLGISKIKENSITASDQTKNVGTSRWMAPEVILTSDMTSSGPDSVKYPRKSDVYSYALICYQIMSGLPPFGSVKPTEWKKLVLAGKRPPEFDMDSRFHRYPARLKTFIEKCWNQEPGARPSFLEICDELRYLKCLLSDHLIGLPSKLRGVISISMTAKGGAVAEVTAQARNSKTEIGRGEFGTIYYEDLRDHQEVPIQVADGSRPGEKKLLNSEGQLLFKGIKMDVKLTHEVLKLINDVNLEADNVCVNKKQCKRLAKRFCGIGEALEAFVTKHDGDTFIEVSAKNQILAVLKKGETLVRANADETKILRNVLDEPFNEVHEEIDDLGTFLEMDQSKTNELANSNAEIGRGEKAPKVTLKGGQSMVDGDREGDVQNMKKGTTEKCYRAESNADDLSYLNISVSEIRELREWKSQAGAHRDGLAPLHIGKWNDWKCAIRVYKSDVSAENREKEIAILATLRHPHVTQLIGCAEDKDKTYVVYEMLDSDLLTLMIARKKERPFSRSLEFSIITQIAEGMFYLHEKGLVHGELECNNLLVKEVGDDINVKVASFHCCIKFWQLGQISSSNNAVPLSDEMLMKEDVFSFAMTCYEVMTGKHRFDGVQGKALEEEIKAGGRPELSEDMNMDLKRLITKCWHVDPEQRPSFQDICYALKVLKVDALADVLGCKKWTDLYPKLKGLKMRSSPEIDDATKNIPHYLRIRPSDLKLGRLLGKGTSAEVFEASWIGCRFAAKWFKVDHVAKVRQEVSIMIKLVHPHVIRLVGFSVLFDRCAIVMELMDISLRDLMDSRIRASKEKRPVPFTGSEALVVITKLALGMNFLHSRGVIHGDLKCAGLLVRNTNLRSADWDVKIADFGLSQLLREDTCFGRWQGTVVGWWRAPEVILMRESNRCVDIDLKAAEVYSFAMVCYEVITGKEPFYDFKSYNTRNAQAKAGGGLKLDKFNVGEKLSHLLKDCWSEPPDRRPKFDEIVTRLT